MPRFQVMVLGRTEDKRKLPGLKARRRYKVEQFIFDSSSLSFSTSNSSQNIGLTSHIVIILWPFLHPNYHPPRPDVSVGLSTPRFAPLLLSFSCHHSVLSHKSDSSTFHPICLLQLPMVPKRWCWMECFQGFLWFSRFQPHLSLVRVKTLPSVYLKSSRMFSLVSRFLAVFCLLSRAHFLLPHLKSQLGQHFLEAFSATVRIGKINFVASEAPSPPFLSTLNSHYQGNYHCYDVTSISRVL